MKPRVSLCMVVRDGEDSLDRCLSSVRSLVDEGIVIVDDRTRDSTVKIAQSHDCRTFSYPWQDSFALARCASISAAKGEWLLLMDADEHLEAHHADKLKYLISQLGTLPPEAVFAFNVVSWILPEGIVSDIAQVRLLHNFPSLRWRYRAMEQCAPALDAADYRTARTTIGVEHDGWLSPEQRRAIKERNLRLHLMDHADMPTDPLPAYWAATSLSVLERYGEAIEYAKRVIRLAPTEWEHLPYLYEVLANCYLMEDKPDVCREVLIEACNRFPANPPLRNFAEQMEITPEEMAL